jgi:hypothetical protein
MFWVGVLLAFWVAKAFIDYKADKELSSYINEISPDHQLDLTWPELKDQTIDLKEILLFEVSSDRIMRFYGEDGEVVGTLDFSQDSMQFTGKATESAQIFLKAILYQFPDLCECQK